MHPIFSSAGKYPSFMQRLIICDKTGAIICLHDLITSVEIAYSPFPLFFKFPMTFKMSEASLGAKKKELFIPLRR